GSKRGGELPPKSAFSRLVHGRDLWALITIRVGTTQCRATVPGDLWRTVRRMGARIESIIRRNIAAAGPGRLQSSASKTDVRIAHAGAMRAHRTRMRAQGRLFRRVNPLIADVASISNQTNHIREWMR